MTEIIELGKLAFVGLISGVFSSLIAYRAHRQKKWWELRVSAYRELINALSDLANYYSSYIADEVDGHKMSDGYKNMINNQWDKSYLKVRRTADSGAFLFSQRVNDALLKFMEVTENYQECYISHWEDNLSEVRHCLKTVVDASKKDLVAKLWWI